MTDKPIHRIDVVEKCARQLAKSKLLLGNLAWGENHWQVNIPIIKQVLSTLATTLDENALVKAAKQNWIFFGTDKWEDSHNFRYATKLVIETYLTRLADTNI